MRNATLRQLKVFEAVARLRSFSRAAEELHLTQPAVSIQVRKLQEHAGLPLLEQLGKQVHLTAAGAQMLQSCREIIQKFQEAEEAMAQFKGVSGGRLNVSVISAGDHFFPQLLVAFAQRHQGVTLGFEVCNREELLARLRENLTDLAVMARPPHDPDIVAEPFAPHPYVVVAAPGHPLARTRRIAPSRIVREPFVVREKGSDTWNAMEQAFGPLVERLNVFMEIRSTETIKQAVMAGMGVGFLSEHTVRREQRAGSLAVLDVAGLPLMLNWHVVHRRAKRLPPVAQAFRAFLMEEGTHLIDRALGGDSASAPIVRASRRKPAAAAGPARLRPAARAGASRR